MTVLNIEEARRKRDEAIARGASAADKLWMRGVEAAIYYLATTLDEFTTDDIWDHMESMEVTTPVETRSLGGAMRRAQAEGWIKPTDRFLNSERPSCHSRPVRVWQSRIVED